MAFLQFSRISLAFGDRDILKNVSLNFSKGTKAALTGANGSGKSTLMKAMAGLIEADSGDRALQKGCRIGYLPQSGIVHHGCTLLEEADRAFAYGYELQSEMEAIGDQLAAVSAPENPEPLLERQHEIITWLEESGWNRRDVLARQTLEGLGFLPSDMNRPVEEFSGGWQMRIALAKVLLECPDILLLDEPTNHLDAETVAWLERHLQQYPGTIIAVTHDRYFLDNVAGWILELDRGEGIPYKGNYSGWLEQKEKRLEMEEKGESERRKALQRELEWIHMGAKGRQAKHKEHISRYEELLNQSGKGQIKDTKITIPAGPRLGNLVIEAEGLTKGYGDRLLFENLSFKVPAGAVIGIVGPNGAGKTTLFKLIADAAGQTVERLDGSEGGEKPDAGSIRVGETVKLVYVDQMRSLLDPDKSVWEQLSDGLDIIKLGAVDEKGRAVAGAVREVNSRAYCSWFNFSGPDQNKKVGVLSGGERNRLNLGMMLKQGGNVLLLDEPTNDLDVTTIRALEDAIQDFAGCVLVVSHDRWFLDRIATHILAFENNSEVNFFEGNWSDYAEWRRKQLGADADRPHKTVYRKMTR